MSTSVIVDLGDCRPWSGRARTRAHRLLLYCCSSRPGFPERAPRTSGCLWDPLRTLAKPGFVSEGRRRLLPSALAEKQWWADAPGGGAAGLPLVLFIPGHAPPPAQPVPLDRVLGHTVPGTHLSGIGSACLFLKDSPYTQPLLHTLSHADGCHGKLSCERALGDG